MLHSLVFLEICGEAMLTGVCRIQESKIEVNYTCTVHKQRKQNSSVDTFWLTTVWLNICDMRASTQRSGFIGRNTR